MKKIIAVPQRSYNNPQLQENSNAKTDAIYFAHEHEAETLVQGL